jgi:hypothetical protein
MGSKTLRADASTPCGSVLEQVTRAMTPQKQSKKSKIKARDAHAWSHERGGRPRARAHNPNLRAFP